MSGTHYSTDASWKVRKDSRKSRTEPGTSGFSGGFLGSGPPEESRTPGEPGTWGGPGVGARVVGGCVLFLTNCGF